MAETRKTKKEIVQMLLKKQLESTDEEELINMLIDEPIAVDVDKQSDANRTIGDRLADKLTEIAGSWTFIIGIIIFLLLWIILNIYILENADPYPFILLNLLLSCVAALQAPIIMMSQNREAKKDRLRSSNDYKTDLKSELILEELHIEIKRLTANQNKIIKMKNKKLVYILIPLILIIVLATFIFYKKSLTTPNLNVETEKECNHEPMLYYEYNDRKIYSYCLSNIEISINNEKTELKDYLINNSLDSLINHLEQSVTFDDGGTTIYKDGGSKKITANGMTLIECKTLEGNNDIYIGPKDMKMKKNFCQSDNTTFTRTYIVDKVSNYTKQQYEGETPVTYSKSLEVTLHEEKKEPVTVIINNSAETPVAGKIYEFEFMIDNKKELKDNIKSIFKNCLVVEIRETTKTGLAQRQDEIK